MPEFYCFSNSEVTFINDFSFIKINFVVVFPCVVRDI